jgi:D-arabinose 1-dehydrogenase-like Zn-dependent alcohol dehydrogenase
MRYLHIGSSHKLSIREKPKPEVMRPEDVLIKVAYASICNYDLMVLRGDASYSPDHTLGHEASGIVVETGAAVNFPSLRPGAPVTMEIYNHCMLCDECRKGHPLYCSNPEEMSGFFGVPPENCASFKVSKQ